MDRIALTKKPGHTGQENKNKMRIPGIATETTNRRYIANIADKPYFL